MGCFHHCVPHAPSPNIFPTNIKNLVSISTLDKVSSLVSFRNFKFDLIKDSIIVGSRYLSDSLYKLSLHLSFKQSFFVNSSLNNKRDRINKNSSMLWHRWLGHIFKQGVKKLVKEGILWSLNFTNFVTCVDCIKVKHIYTSKKGVRRSKETLEIIYTNTCSPFFSMSNRWKVFYHIHWWLFMIYVYVPYAYKVDIFEIYREFKTKVETIKKSD